MTAKRKIRPKTFAFEQLESREALASATVVINDADQLTSRRGTKQSQVDNVSSVRANIRGNDYFAAQRLDDNIVAVTAVSGNKRVRIVNGSTSDALTSAVRSLRTRQVTNSSDLLVRGNASQVGEDVYTVTKLRIAPTNRTLRTATR